MMASLGSCPMELCQRPLLCLPGDDVRSWRAAAVAIAIAAAACTRAPLHHACKQAFMH
jgi:hypothetical protein